MNLVVRTVSVATALFVTAASADTVKGTGYSASFPCQVKANSQTVTAGKMAIPLTSNTCEKDGAVYFVSVSTFPKGFVAKRTLRAALVDSVAGSATNVSGVVRAQGAVTLAGVRGQEALIDIKPLKAVAHLRVFFVGDQQYQVMFLGPAGQEKGKAAMAFLGSFKLGK